MSVIRTNAQAILDAASFAHNYSQALEDQVKQLKHEVARLKAVVGAKDMELGDLKQRLMQLTTKGKRTGVHYHMGFMHHIDLINKTVYRFLTTVMYCLLEVS